MCPPSWLAVTGRIQRLPVQGPGPRTRLLLWGLVLSSSHFVLGFQPGPPQTRTPGPDSLPRSSISTGHDSSLPFSELIFALVEGNEALVPRNDSSATFAVLSPGPRPVGLTSPFP